MKIVTVIGARPQFIKAAPFSEVFRARHQEVLIHTGQHYDDEMSDVFFRELNIPTPDYNLAVGSGSHGFQTGRMLEGIEEILLKEKPDGVLVYGDTNSTLAGAIAASKLHIPVFHVEAGLRSYDKHMPEEQNRILTDHISSLLLCPTETAIHNLDKEGIHKGVINTGDVMYDAVIRNRTISDGKYSSGRGFEALQVSFGILAQIKEGQYYLATIHRAENTDDSQKLKTIFEALEELDKPVLFPMHPRTRLAVERLGIKKKNIVVVNPVGYLLMLNLMSNAHMILTDSGGVQKEAYFLKVPCTTFRDQTEWVETLQNDWNALTPIQIEAILKTVQRTITCNQHPQPLSFGNGDAAHQIVKAIEHGGFNDTYR